MSSEETRRSRVGRDDSTCRTRDDIYARRKREIRQNFKGRFVKKDLTGSLEEAKIRSAEDIARHCETDARNLSPIEDDTRTEKISFVIAYTLDFGEEEKEEQPYRVLNEALVSCNPMKMKDVRYFLYGLLEGLYSLPYMQFSKLYRGIDVKVKWEREDMRVFPSFASTSRDRGVGEKFLRDGRSGTLITLNGLSGYDVCGYSDFSGEKEVILEPFQGVFVCEVSMRWVYPEHLLLTFLHRAGVTTYTSHCWFADGCVFDSVFEIVQVNYSKRY